MTHLLPPNLLRLFAPRAPIPYLKPLVRDLTEPTNRHLTGVSALLEEVREENALKDAEEESKRDAKRKGVSGVKKEEDAGPGGGGGTMDVDEDKENKPDVKGVKKELGEVEEGEAVEAPAADDDEERGFTLTEAEKYHIRVEERKRKREQAFKNALETYKPTEDPEAVGDPYRTLFISRLSYQATEEDLRREFGMYGPIERIRVVREKEGKHKGKSRGYAFILFEREKDMKNAYKDAEGIKILGRRILVDVERGRTVKGWKPRRLGGGLGGRPKPVPAEIAAPSFGGGGRGGFRGGRGGGFGRGGGGGFRDGGGGGFRGGRGGGVGFRGGFNQGGPPRGDRDFGGPPPRGGPPGGGGGFNQRDLIGQQSGSGWGQRSAQSSGGPPPMQQGGYGGPPQQSFPPRGAPAGPPPGGFGGPPSYGAPRPQDSAYSGSNSFEVPRGGGGYDSRDRGSSSRDDRYGDSRGGYDSRDSRRDPRDRDGYGDRDSKRPRY